MTLHSLSTSSAILTKACLSFVIEPRMRTAWYLRVRTTAARRLRASGLGGVLAGGGVSLASTDLDLDLGDGPRGERSMA